MGAGWGLRRCRGTQCWRGSRGGTFRCTDGPRGAYRCAVSSSIGTWWLWGVSDVVSIVEVKNSLEVRLVDGTWRRGNQLIVIAVVEVSFEGEFLSLVRQCEVK